MNFTPPPAIDAMLCARRFALDFSVLEVQDQLLLLGLDQLRRFRCIIDLEQNVLVFGGAGGVQVPFLEQERVRRYIQRTPLDGCRQMLVVL